MKTGKTLTKEHHHVTSILQQFTVQIYCHLMTLTVNFLSKQLCPSYNPVEQKQYSPEGCQDILTPVLQSAD